MSKEFNNIFNLLHNIESKNMVCGVEYKEILNCIIATNSEGKLCFFDLNATPISDSNFDIRKKSDVEKMDAKDKLEYYKKHYTEYSIDNEVYIIKKK